MDEKFQYRRLPATPKKITDINPEKDVRVRIFGRIIEKADGTIIVDDGSSTATIVAESAQCEINDMVRVFARVLPLEDGYELRGEIVQTTNFDMDLYKKVYGEN